MPHYEIIYETGAHGVAFYENDAERDRALAAHHKKALSGEEGGPSGHSAERIVKVLEYDAHPDGYNAEQTLSADVAKKEMEAALKASTNKDGVVSIPELTAAMRDVTRPLYDKNAMSTHDSMFKMEESKEVDSASWTNKEGDK